MLHRCYENSESLETANLETTKFVNTICGTTTAQHRAELASLVRWLLEDCSSADLEPRLSLGLCKCFCRAHHADEAHMVSAQQLGALISGSEKQRNEHIANLLRFLVGFQPRLAVLFSVAASSGRQSRDALPRTKPPGPSSLVTSQELAHAVRAALEGTHDSKVRTLAHVESNVAARFGASTFADLGQVTVHPAASPARPSGLTAFAHLDLLLVLQETSLLSFLNKNEELLRDREGTSRVDAEALMLRPSSSRVSADPVLDRVECQLRKIANDFGLSTTAQVADEPSMPLLASRSRRLFLLPTLLDLELQTLSLDQLDEEAGSLEAQLATALLSSMRNVPALLPLDDAIQFETSYRPQLPAYCKTLLHTLVWVDHLYPELWGDLVVYCESSYCCVRLAPECPNPQNGAELASNVLSHVVLSPTSSFSLSSWEGDPAKNLPKMVVDALVALPPHARRAIGASHLVQPASERISGLDGAMLAEALTRPPPQRERLALHTIAGQMGWTRWLDDACSWKTLGSTAPVSEPKLHNVDAREAPTVPLMLVERYANISRPVHDEHPSMVIASEMECEAVISSIRRGHGVEMRGNDVVDGLIARSTRAVAKLSEDLYSSQTHFVLELLQNADDNTYAKGVEPRVHFTLDSSSVLLVQCNEQGFEEKHVRALCDIGASTKSAKTGFIGQKGIGFKAVFAVSDAPEVHSAGYHFRFSKESYMIPEWIACANACPSGSWATTIKLPLRNEFRADPHRLITQLDALSPCMLLFLQRLHEISLCLPQRPALVMRRDGGRTGLIRLTVSGGLEVTTSMFFVHRLQIRPPVGILRNDVEVAETEIALAFSCDGSTDIPRMQPMHAFLPLRSYGFRFVIHADFELTSSRQEVSVDKQWNKLLLKKVPEAFAEALRCVIRSPDIMGRMQIYGTIPLSHEITDASMKQLAENCRTLLKAVSCVKGLDGEWHRPGETVSLQHLPMIDAALIRECVTDLELFVRANGLSMLDDESSVAAGMNTAIRRALGVHDFSAEHLIKYASLRMRELNQVEISRAHDLPTSVLQWYGEALAASFRVAQAGSAGDREHFRGLMRSTRPFPRLVSSVTSPDDGDIFIDFDEHSNGVSEAIQRRLTLLDPRLLSCATPHTRALLQQALELAGVLRLSTTDVLMRLVLPTLVGEEPPSASFSDDDLVEFLRFAKGADITWADHRGQLWMLNSFGARVRSSTLAIGPAYDPSLQRLQDAAPAMFEGRHVVNSRYLPDGCDNPSDWLDFLFKVGVCEFFAPDEVLSTSCSYTAQADSPWRHEVPWGGSDESGAFLRVGRDTASQSIVAALELVDAMQNRGMPPERLRAAGDALWDVLDGCMTRSFPEDWHTANVTSPRALVPSPLRSSLAIAMANYKWIPASSNLRGAPTLLSAEMVFNAPINDLRGWVPTKPGNQGRALAAIIRPTPDSRAMFATYMTTWDAGVPVELPLSALYRAYDLILGTPSTAKLATEQQLRIFVPSRSMASLDSDFSQLLHTPVDGEFHDVSKLVWKDPANGISERLGLLRTLEKHFVRMRPDCQIPPEQLFRRLNVPSVPRWTDHLECLRLLTEPRRMKIALASVAAVIKCVSSSHASGRMPSDGLLKWVEAFNKEQLLPTLSARTWTLSSCALMDDGVTELPPHFASELQRLGLHLIDPTLHSPPQADEAIAFLASCGCSRLSDVVQIEVQKEGIVPGLRRIEDLVRIALLAAQCYFLQSQPVDVCEREVYLIQERLRSCRIFGVGRLLCVRRLCVPGVRKDLPVDTQQRSCALDGSVIYITAQDTLTADGSRVRLPSEIYTELSRFICGQPDKNIAGHMEMAWINGRSAADLMAELRKHNFFAQAQLEETDDDAGDQEPFWLIPYTAKECAA